MIQHVEIYTDGSCFPNPGTGGWSALLFAGGRCRVIYAGETETTNNRMEMLGAIRGLQALTRPVAVTLYTDSQYLQKGASIWLKNWIKKDRLKSRKNPDLWLEIHALQSKHDVTWKWVKGHNGHPQNELADYYADLGYHAARKGDTGVKSLWLS